MAFLPRSCLARPHKQITDPGSDSATSATASAAVSTAMSELESLREECERERRHSERLAKRLHVQLARRDEEVTELRLDTANLGSSLEEKEQDVLSMQFEFVEVQSRLRDQTELVRDQTHAIQAFTQELADKDDKLELTQALLSQKSELVDQLQKKVMVLNQELEGSHAAQEALGKELQAVIAKHESEQQSLTAGLVRVRAEATAESTDLRAQIRQQEAAAAEQRGAFEQELQAVQKQAERSALELAVQLKSEKLALTRASAEAGFREAMLLEELRMEAAKHEHFLQKLREASKVVCISPWQSHVDAAAGWQQAHEGVVEVLMAEAAGNNTSHARELQEKLAAKFGRLTYAKDQLLDLAMAMESGHPLESRPLRPTPFGGGGGAARKGALHRLAQPCPLDCRSAGA